MRRSLPVLVLTALIAVLPAGVFLAMRGLGWYDRAVPAPTQHFYIVSSVALISLVLAAFAAAAALRVPRARVLLLALSFLTMAGFFSVHGLATPGFIVESRYFAVTGFSARLSLLAASILLAASTAEPPPAVARAMVRWRGALLLGTVGSLGAYAALGLALPESVPPRIVSERLFLDGTLVVMVALTALAAYRYFEDYRRSGRPIHLSVALGALLLLEAQVTMHFGSVWYLSWWLYHLQLLGAFSTLLWGLLAEYARGAGPLRAFEDLGISDAIEQIRSGRAESILSLAAALEARDGYTLGHGERVAALAVLVGQQMRLPAGRLRALAQGALLHDVGKIGVPDAILHKPGPLTLEERAVIEEHPARGDQMLATSFSGAGERAVIRHHHERWDGSGYPDRLAGDAIPMEARIGAVADVYDALRSERAYRGALSRERASAYIQENAGTHFDPLCADALLAVVDRWEAEFAEATRSYEAHRPIPMAA